MSTGSSFKRNILERYCALDPFPETGLAVLRELLKGTGSAALIALLRRQGCLEFPPHRLEVGDLPTALERCSRKQRVF